MGSWFGWPTDTTHCTQSCQDILLKRRDTLAAVDTSAIHFPVIPGASDLTCRVYTTRKATVSLFRVRFAMHALDALERGDLDAYLRADIDTLFLPQDSAMALVRRRLMRFGVHDEPFTPIFRQVAIASVKPQDFLNAQSPNDRRGLFQNTTSNFDGWRLFSAISIPSRRDRSRPT